ncbi:FAD-dependent oxidoreductase [Virgibacillus sp. 179-BFC.A HS]|uniref:FAD-dependent oxidoreductase n=1 Tax=Tigheibacillus jepli TaxID=3035914 RepID=A0ABU5CJI5_9BACI|nr:FAD-dependent oxidoreductase [Virgibacillus sp. 179-BFC.A HS]MDY0406532.1 FAD-dependent oxidoreductase [Virgibacillus sp. 179-BFC.A HS]
MKTDLFIIGGGPAGLHAASVAATYGIETMIVDESFSLGGQLRQQTQQLRNLPKSFKTQTGTALAKQMIEKLRQLDVTKLVKHTMIGTYQDGRIGVTDGHRTIPISANKIIVATGAAEEACAFPGWTLPGVMTVGAAQILLNREYVRPGKNALILGSNNFALQVAKQLAEGGVNVKGIIENKERMEGNETETIDQLQKIGVPLYFNSTIQRAFGREKVEKVILNHGHKALEMDVDLICIGKGLSPILEPFEILDCHFTYEQALGGWLPVYSLSMQTSNPSVYVAGNAAGITDMGAILLTAEIAAVSIAESLECVNNADADKTRKLLWQELEQIESESFKRTFQARANVVKRFQEETDLSQVNGQ